jgi:hypothetical protein
VLAPIKDVQLFENVLLAFEVELRTRVIYQAGIIFPDVRRLAISIFSPILY